MNTVFEKLKDIYWNNKIMKSEDKEKMFYFIKKIIRGSNKQKHFENDVLKEYKDLILNIQMPSTSYQEMQSENYLREDTDTKLLAYYLPQFYPTPYNDKWWGRGTTEWRNVSKGMPQFVGHYQPRLPRELGFYDLRLIENIERQVELAKYFGIYGFCFYYYWFDGKRLLDLPVDLFLNSKIKFPFCFCWANENWSKQWFGTSEEALIVQSQEVNSYKKFITSIIPYIVDDRYMSIDNRKILVIYRPKSIPNINEILEYWRYFVKKETAYDLYLIAAMNDKYDVYKKLNFIEKGFDAISEFCLGPQREFLKDIRDTKKFVCHEFYGNIYDYKDFVENKKYFLSDFSKLFRAITPMWDNSARKVNKGIVFDGSTPELYQKWLEDIILEAKDKYNKNLLDENLIFINAWNEWSEGAYLEPDLKWGYGYLNATLNAILNTRGVNEQ